MSGGGVSPGSIGGAVTKRKEKKWKLPNLALTSGHTDFKGGRLVYFPFFATLNPEKNHDGQELVLPKKVKQAKK